VRVKPVTDDGAPYLNTKFEGGDMPLLTWLAMGDAANQPSPVRLVAGTRLWTYLLRPPGKRSAARSFREINAEALRPQKFLELENARTPKGK
jgi:hypothetical protein